MVYNQKYAAQFMIHGEAPENVEEIQRENVLAFAVSPSSDITWYNTFIGPHGFDLGSKYIEVTYPGANKQDWCSMIDQEGFTAIWDTTLFAKEVAEVLWDSEAHWCLLNGHKRDLVFFDQLDVETRKMYLYLANLFYVINGLQLTTTKSGYNCLINYKEVSEGILGMLNDERYDGAWPTIKLRPDIDYLNLVN